MAVFLITGMSGTGKSAALGQLRQRGYAAVDTDIGGWIELAPGPGGAGLEPQWREDLIGALIARHERSADPLFIGGTVWNQRVFYPRFREIVLLTAPLAVMLERIAARRGNPFGKTPQERERVIADTAAVEPLLRSSASIVIDTRQPLAEVVDRLAALAGPPPPPAGPRPAR